jgi:26 proteasome complex subunit DSS1
VLQKIFDEDDDDFEEFEQEELQNVQYDDKKIDVKQW